MRLRLALWAFVSFGVVLVSGGASSFLVDPENLGVRIALYAIALFAFVASVTLAIFAIAFPLFGRVGVPPAEVAAAVAAGRQAYARVIAARANGSRLNGGRGYDVTLVVASTDVAPYQADDRVRVQRTDGRLTGAGELVTVVRLAVDAPQVVVTNGPASTPQDRAVPADAPPWPGATR